MEFLIDKEEEPPEGCFGCTSEELSGFLSKVPEITAKKKWRMHFAHLFRSSSKAKVKDEVSGEGGPSDKSCGCFSEF